MRHHQIPADTARFCRKTKRDRPTGTLGTIRSFSAGKITTHYTVAMRNYISAHYTFTAMQIEKYFLIGLLEIVLRVFLGWSGHKNQLVVINTHGSFNERRNGGNGMSSWYDRDFRFTVSAFVVSATLSCAICVWKAIFTHICVYHLREGNLHQQ